MVDLPNNKSWFDFANWISRTFFDDCLEVINSRNNFLFLQEKIKAAINAYTFLIDLTKSSPQEINLFKQVVEEVILLNQKNEKKFDDPKFRDVYSNKLNNLHNILQSL